MRSTVLVLALLVSGAALAQQSEAQKPYSVVEPKAPAKAKPAARKRVAKANAKAKAAPRTSVVAQAEGLKRNGPCVIKPVMTDQDLVNCGATPQH
jgi:hypothetical protein